MTIDFHLGRYSNLYYLEVSGTTKRETRRWNKRKRGWIHQSLFSTSFCVLQWISNRYHERKGVEYSGNYRPVIEIIGRQTIITYRLRKENLLVSFLTNLQKLELEMLHINPLNCDNASLRWISLVRCSTLSPDTYISFLTRKTFQCFSTINLCYFLFIENFHVELITEWKISHYLYKYIQSN